MGAEPWGWKPSQMSSALGCLRMSDHDGHFLPGSSQQAHPELCAAAALLSQRCMSHRAERIATLPEQPLHAAFGSATGEPMPLPPRLHRSVPSPTSFPQDLQLGEGGRSRSLRDGVGAPALGACSSLLHGFGSRQVIVVCCRADALAGDAWLRRSPARWAPSATEMPQQHCTLLRLSRGNGWSCELFQRHEAEWGPQHLRRADAAVLGSELSHLGQ